MKRWAALTVLLYLLALLVITVPVVLVAFAKWSWLRDQNGISWPEALGAYGEWSYWVWLGVMGLCQALLLLVPVGIAERRLPARRPLLAPILTTAFLLANIFLSGFLSVLCAIFREKAFEVFAFIGGMVWNDDFYDFLTKKILNNSIIPSPTALEYIFGTIGAIALLWLVWGIIFYRFARADDPHHLIKRSTKWLLRGSILEFLVAVPSHIIVRNRNDCCAPFGTFWGLTTGLSIMLLCFGPGVFFLFAERFARLQPKQDSANLRLDPQ